MDKLKKLKDAIGKVGIGKDAIEQLNKILDVAIARGSLDQEEKDKLLTILDFEIENENLQADMMEDLASALGSLTSEIEDSEEIYADELNAVEKDVDEFLGEDKLAETQPVQQDSIKTVPAPVVTPIDEEAKTKQEDNAEISKIRESLQQAATSDNQPSTSDPIPPVTPPPFPSTPPQS